MLTLSEAVSQLYSIVSLSEPCNSRVSVGPALPSRSLTTVFRFPRLDARELLGVAIYYIQSRTITP